MKKISLFIILSVMFCGNISFAQLIGGQGFLQGRYLEIGEIANASFGATPAPAGYHQNCPFCFPTTVLSQVYDWGHDGWATGTPAFMGDYTYPGAPCEGWALQANGQYNQAYVGGGFGGTGSLTGALLSYSNGGGIISTDWRGTAVGGNLDIQQETRVDTAASWVVVTTTFRNKTSTPVADVYYMRACDPDNATQWGGSFSTMNTIVYQNDWNHRVLVSAFDPGPTLGTTETYLGIGTKDCRAKAFIMDGGLIPFFSAGFMPDNIYNGTGGASGYFYSGTNSACWGGLGCDVGIGIVYKLGTIAGFDSTIISYAYIFNGDNGIDSAFPDPVLNINNGAIVSLPVYPYNLKQDTFDACLYPGLDSIPIVIPYADDKAWSWSKWTWSPGVGLSATTGTKVWAHITSIPGFVTYTVTGTDSNANMFSCNQKTFIFTIKSCHAAWNNGPCEGDSLWLRMSGDSLGASYVWVGPKGFRSTLHNPFKYPAVMSDTGVYYVFKTIAGIVDTDSTRVVVHPKPVLTATNNSPLCEGMVDTLNLSAMPSYTGMTYQWSGPFGYTATSQFPTVPGFVKTHTGLYTVIGTTPFGCKDTASVPAILIPPPLPPIISGKDKYCQGDTYIPIIASPNPPGSTAKIQWYNVPVGGTPMATAPLISTAVPGMTTVWATQITGSCESPRAEYTVTVITTPKAPSTSAKSEYCQFIGPFVPFVVTPNPLSATLNWYNSAIGGTLLPAAPTVDIDVAGNYKFWVSQKDSGCEGPRSPIVVDVHPKPVAPRPNSYDICQFWPASALTAVTSTPGGQLRWFIGMADTIGNITAPVPSTVAPITHTYFVNEKSIYGCVSDKAKATVIVKPQPGLPVTRDTMYCQWTIGAALTADATPGAKLQWYAGGQKLAFTPIPYNSKPGDSTWYVNQTVNGCTSDSVPLKVTTIYKPVFEIAASSPFVCQFDSIRLAYKGPSIVDPKYIWSLPKGAVLATSAPDGVKSDLRDSMIYVRFDSVVQNNYVFLHTTNNGGFCSGDTSLRIKIVPQPQATSKTRRDVCQNDTVALALGSRSASAAEFFWTIDGEPLMKNNIISMIAHSSGTGGGGPFSISWNDSGRHVIALSTRSLEGCLSLPTEDTISVHVSPDASFKFLTKDGTLCLEDSVLFTANNLDYRNQYEWTPAHYFHNINKPEIYGRVEQSQSIVQLRVTDPFGCSATSTQQLDPGSCCTVGFPNAFTPNGDNKNDFFRPIFVGYHRFHTFRVANRWGQTVFESTNNNMKWDGNYNGVPQDMGVYFYYISYDCGGKTIEQSGDVTLIR